MNVPPTLGVPPRSPRDGRNGRIHALMKFAPCWPDTAPPFTGGREGPAPARADAVVVGGGLNGVSAALGRGLSPVGACYRLQDALR